jgi:hypothetical protein
MRIRRLFLILWLVIGWSILLVRQDSNRWGRMVAQAQQCCINEGEYSPHLECVGDQCIFVEGCGIDNCSSCEEGGCDPSAEIECINNGGIWDSITCTCDEPECEPCEDPECIQDPITCACECECETETIFVGEVESGSYTECNSGVEVECTLWDDCFEVVDCNGFVVDAYCVPGDTFCIETGASCC